MHLDPPRLRGPPVFMNQIFDLEGLLSSPLPTTIWTIEKVTAHTAYQCDYVGCPLAASSANKPVVVVLGRGEAGEGADGEKRMRRGGRVRHGGGWEEKGRWEHVGEGGGGGLSILQSCRLDILCFDGLAFIFTAVFLCRGGAVLKSSIFSWYYRTHGRLW